MGVWSQVTGEIQIHREAHVSVIHTIRDIFDEISMGNFTQEDARGDMQICSFSFAFSESNEVAVRYIREWLADIKSKCGAYPHTFDIQTDIRWVG